MSHHYAWAIVPADGDVQELVEKTMAPFDEHREVEQYAEGGETYWRNQVGIWDWWTIGGRWTGALSNYDPQRDPANWEDCFLCHGTGKRDDELGRQARAENPEYGCNGCGQYREITGQAGVSVKWPTGWVQHDGDILDALTVTSQLAELRTPYAIFTHDSESYAVKEEWVSEYGPNGEFVDGEFIDRYDDEGMRAYASRVLVARMQAGLKDLVVVVDYHC